MPKVTKTLGNSKGQACESPAFVRKKEGVPILTHPLSCIFTISSYINQGRENDVRKAVIGNEVKQSSGRVYSWIASGCAFAMTGPFCIPTGRAPSSAGL